MKRVEMRFLLSLIAAILLLTFHTANAESGFISPSQIHQGMVGYGKTVFHGTKIETFKVTVLGVLPKAIADTDLILVRIDSPYLRGKKIGLVAGMSGSPIYFNGKLAGAIAYGWPFTREALAGITPIEPMLRAGQEGTPTKLAIGAPSLIQIKNLPASVRRSLPAPLAAPSLTLEPLGIPVSVSGFDTAGVNRLQSAFPFSMVVPGGGTSKRLPSGPLEPGQSVSAGLMEGDFSVVATGTLTYRNGSKVLAFGHPFLFLGEVDFPLYQSYVHYVLPSIQLPFKFSSPVKEVGKVSQDRLYSIGGLLGGKASMVPLDITVADPDRHLKRSFHVRLFRHPDFTPRLTGAALEQAISSTSRLLGEATAHLDYEVDFKNHAPLHLKNVVLSEQSISSVIGAEILKPMLRVLGNDFERVDLARIKVEVSIQPKLAAATLQRVVLNKHHLIPGEPLWVTVFLKPYNESVVERKFEIPIPSDIQGNVQVGVAGGTNAEQLRKTMQQPLPEPLNVDQIIHQIQETDPDNSLVIRLTFPRRGIHWGGEDFANMPQPYADLLKAAGSDPLDFHADGTATQYIMPWVVIGTDIEDITIGAAKEASSSSSKPHRIPPHSPELPPIPPMIEEPGSTRVISKDAVPSLQDSSSSSPSEPSVSEPSEPKGSENRQTSLESLSSLKDWQEGKLLNLAISSKGDLFLGPEMKSLATFDENVLLSETRSGDNLYVGTANPGKIYKISSTGEKSLFFDPKSVAVLSMASLRNGELLAGVTGGELFWLDPAGKPKHKWKLKEDYIWQILMVDGVAYIATGGPLGSIYKLDPRENNPVPKLHYTSSQSHILSLYSLENGKLFAGTANDGLLLEIDPHGTSRTLYDFDELAILALSGTSDGKLIIGTSGKGKVYLLDGGNQIQKIADLPDENVTWVGTREGKILAGTGIPARLYVIKQHRAPSLLWDGKTDEQVAFKGESNQSNDFYVSGTKSALLNISSKLGSHGEFLSKVMDAGVPAKWGKLAWHGEIPTGTEILVQSRAGNSPVPDLTWSPWTHGYLESGQSISGPASRYIQFKVELRSEKKETTPHLEAIHYFWRQENLPPAIEVTSPSPGDIIGPKTTLHGRIRDKNGDTVKVELWVEKIKDSDKPPERVFVQLYPISKSKGEDDLSIPLDMIHAEGHLHLRLTISDSPGNKPEAALSAETVIKDLIYDSTPPSLKITKVTHNKNSTGVEGIAEDKISYIRTVKFRLDDGPWLDTIPEKDIFDSPEAKFSFELDHDLEAEKIEIRAFDGADNVTTLKKDFAELTGNKEAAEKAKAKKLSKKNAKSEEDSSTKKTEKTKDDASGKKKENPPSKATDDQEKSKTVPAAPPDSPPKEEKP